MKYADTEIQEMEEFFKTAGLPESIQIDAGVIITNLPAFIYSHLQIIKLRKGVPIFEAFYDRLLTVKEMLLKEQGVA